MALSSGGAHGVVRPLRWLPHTRLSMRTGAPPRLSLTLGKRLPFGITPENQFQGASQPIACPGILKAALIAAAIAAAIAVVMAVAVVHAAA